MEEPSIRIAQPADLPRIVEIYNQAIPSKRSTGYTLPVRTEDREVWFAEHDPGKHPIFVAELAGIVAGWCSLSAYRPGRMAFRFTAEISHYVDDRYQRRGIATALVRYALSACTKLQIKNVFGILLEPNVASIRLMEKLGFELWGRLPHVADFDGNEYDHLYFGKRICD